MPAALPLPLRATAGHDIFSMLLAACRLRLVRVGRRPPLLARALSAPPFWAWASLDPLAWDGARPHTVRNLVAGQWGSAAALDTFPDPLNGEPFLRVPATAAAEL